MHDGSLLKFLARILVLGNPRFSNILRLWPNPKITIKITHIK
jgi:hypothetical protein